jgi:CBS domain-containing protein
MTPADRLPVISPDVGLDEALKLMGKHDTHQLPVVEDSTLLGFVTRGDIMRTIRLRAKLGVIEKRGTPV